MKNLERIKQLEVLIQRSAQKYYQDGSSDYDDETFDKMVEELRSLNPESRVLSEPSYGYRVEEDTTYGERFPHRYGEVGTLDKAYSDDEIMKPLLNPYRTLVASPKLDGMSVVLYYVNGRLDRALTRGNYTTGIDITDKASYIVGNVISDAEFTGGVRGEIIMSKDNYEKYLLRHEGEDVKNSRNAVAGIINQKGLSPDLDLVHIVVYTIKGIEKSGNSLLHPNVDDNIDVLASVMWLESNFQNVAPYVVLPPIQESKMFEHFSKLREMISEKFPYENDGIVVSLNIIEVVGVVCYYTQQAMKFKAETAVTTVINVQWELTKTKYLFPTVIIEPVELSGATIAKCSGINAKYIKDNKILPGVKVEVERHGEVIPYINEVITKIDAEIDDYLPTTCPSCGENLIWNGVHLQCPNPCCNNGIMQDAMIWINNIAPLENFGDKLRIKYISQILGKDEFSIKDVMTSEKLKEAARVPNTPLISKQMKLFGKMLEKLFYSKVPMEYALKAINIPRLGDVTCKKLASSEYWCVRLMTKIFGPDDMSDFQNFIGSANADSILSNIRKFENIYNFLYLENRIVFNSSESSKGKVAVTGKLSVKRNEFQKELENSGWELTELKKDCKFLITDDPNSNSSKNKNADKWGITKISESDFRNTYM